MIRLLAIAAITALAFAATHTTLADSKPMPVNERTITAMPQAFTSFGAARQGDFLYVIGGHTSAAHQYDNAGFNRQFYRLNLKDRQSWEVLPGGVALQSVALVSDGARLIRVGGMTALNNPGEDADLNSTTEVAAFDPLTRQWADLPKLPEPRSSHDAIVADGKLFVLGGWKLAQDALSRAGEEGDWYKTGLVLDLNAETPAWAEIEQPFVKRALAVAEVGGNIYAIGGMSEDGQMTSTSHYYNVAEGKWTQGPDIPGRGFGSSAYGQDGRVFTTTFEGGLYSHAPGEKEWRSEGTLTYPRFFHRLIGIGSGEFAVLAGSARGGHIRNIEWIKPAKGPGITRLSMPAPGTAKVRQGIFFHNNHMYVFGGNNAVKDHQFAPENFVNEAFKISLNGLHAERIAELPLKRQSFVTFMQGTDDRLAEKLGFAVGGFGHDGHDGGAAVTHAEILQYSVDADVWDTAQIKLPARLTQFGMAEHDGKIYLFGGMDFDPARGKKEQFQESETIWMWNPKAEDETSKSSFVALEPKMPIKRRAFAGAVHDGKYYIVGGMTKSFEEVDQCDVYDFATGKWSTIPAPSDVRLSPRLIPLNGKLYLVGGSSPTETGFVRNPGVECFDPATGNWSTIIADIGVDLGESQAFAFGNRILLYSAHNADGLLHFVFIEP